MLAYALFFGFVSAFVVLTAIGHFLLLTAVYPDLFGGGAPDNTAAAGEIEPRQQPLAMPASKLAA